MARDDLIARAPVIDRPESIFDGITRNEAAAVRIECHRCAAWHIEVGGDLAAGEFPDANTISLPRAGGERLPSALRAQNVVPGGASSSFTTLPAGISTSRTLPEWTGHGEHRPLALIAPCSHPAGVGIASAGPSFQRFGDDSTKAHRCTPPTPSQPSGRHPQMLTHSRFPE